ncbi:hypothetical protein [Nocardioides sp. AX2bis]|uniref:hypothetical protein n=1 Tax=Nocardioides sp. AX2bis TaxID=2653157 RepID=UPI0012F20BB3|nr:hypothetical protein [Nocardioides sp. AX2bis]VXB84267.1 conserved hypothetical protein [Nocardioides sp. AX2bis]
MTDRLQQMLRDEADGLTVPPAPAGAVLEAGRRRRRRRTGAAAAAAGALTVAVAGAAVGLGHLDRGGPSPDTASDPAAGSGAVFSVGRTVYLDDGAASARVDDTVVKSLYYTSAGVLVRHGDDPASDGGGPQRFSLVRPDGSVSPVSVETEETAHATDPAQPYLAWAEATPDGAEVVVHDVDTDVEVARVPVPGRFSWSPPPVSLDGDTVYVGGGRTTWAVDWRSGEVVDSGLDTLFPQVAGGRTVTTDREGSSVVDAATGRVLLAVPTEDGVFVDVQLSPDGRYALLVSEPDVMTTLGSAAGEVSVVDVGTGATVGLPPEIGQGLPGWTPEGEPFVVTGDTLVACSPVDGTCAETALEIEDLPDPEGGTPARDYSQELRLGGRTYES